MVCVVALVSGALFIASCAGANPYCTPKTATSDKKLPDLNLPAFTTEYRAIIQDKRFTVWAKESYDSVNNKARMDVLKNGLLTTLLLDYNNNTYITYEYMDKKKEQVMCHIDELDKVKSDNFDIFGFKAKPSSQGAKTIPHILSSSHILQFAKDIGEEYIEQTLIDELPVDHFQSCVTWDDKKATFTLDYYFTTSAFKPRDSLTPSQVPVRAEVQGVVEEAGQSRKFHHVYEYLDFRAFPELPPETFSIPEFVICSGAVDVWQRPFPKLPADMSYTVETVTHSANGDVKIELADVHIDADWKLVRVDQVGTTSISDFSTGVEYILDDNGCSPRPIHPDNVAWSQADGKGVIKMKDRPEIAYLKQGKNFFFGGFKKFRELSTNSYALQVTDEKVEAYISTDGKTPVGIFVRNTKESTATYYNIFNFDKTSNRSSESPFDIQRCRGSGDMSDFTVVLKSSSNRPDVSESVIKRLAVSLRQKAAKLSGVSPMQIISKDFRWGVPNFYWTIRILEKDPDSKQAQVENRLSMKPVSEIRLALYQALGSGELTVDYPSDARYHLYITAITMASTPEYFELSVESDIRYTFRKETGMCVKKFIVDPEKSTKHNAHECAQACADSRDVACNLFEYVKQTKTCQLSWTEQTPELMAGNGCDVYRNSYLSQFSAKPGYVMMRDTGVDFQKAKDVESCAKLCMGETRFACESFDYCQAEERCQTYKTHFYSDDARPVQGSKYTKDCSHYARRYDEFAVYFQTDFESPEALELRMDNYHECSYRCAKDEDGCMAFTYCYRDVKAGEEQGLCRILPSSQARHVTFIATSKLCSLGVAKGLQGAGKVKAEPLQIGGGDADSGLTYGGNAMIGLAVAMAAIGAGVTGLVVFLLKRFGVWGGF